MLGSLALVAAHNFKMQGDCWCIEFNELMPLKRRDPAA